MICELWVKLSWDQVVRKQRLCGYELGEGIRSSSLCCCCIHFGRMELFCKMTPSGRIEIWAVIYPLQVYSNYALIVCWSRGLFACMTKRSSMVIWVLTMLHDDVSFRHVRVGDVGKTVRPWRVDRTRLVKVWTGTMNRDQLASPIEMGP